MKFRLRLYFTVFAYFVVFQIYRISPVAGGIFGYMLTIYLILKIFASWKARQRRLG